MKLSFAILLTLFSSVLAHPVSDPDPPTLVSQVLKRAGVTFSSCTVPNKVALTYVDTHFNSLPTDLLLVASMTAHMPTWYCYKYRFVSYSHSFVDGDRRHPHKRWCKGNFLHQRR
jgi:hypothetical protein